MHDAELVRARADDAPRGADVRALPAGCCRATYATTSTASTSSSARSTTPSTTATPTPTPGCAAVEAWARGAPSDSREVRLLDALARRHPLPRSAFADFCAGMRDDLRGTPILGEADVDELLLPGRRDRRHRDGQRSGDARSGARAAGRRGARAGDAAHEHPARHRRGPGGRPRLPRAVDARALRRVARPRPARGAAARPDRPRRRPLRDRLEGIGQLLRGRRAIRTAATMYREILRQIERDGYGERAGRAVVPRRRKLRVAMISR